MFLNSWPNRSRGDAGPPKRKNYFDFAVSQRPVYTRGSGPPLQPITPIPSKTNDDGVILELFESSPSDIRYLVGSKSKPELRVSVKIMDILDWVSPRTFEEWNRARAKQVAHDLKLLAIQVRAKKILEQGVKSREAPATTKGILLKRTTVAAQLEGKKVIPGLGLIVRARSGPGRRGRPRKQPTVVVHIPRQFNSPSSKHQRGLAEVINLTSEDDEVEASDENEARGLTLTSSDQTPSHARSYSPSRHSQHTPPPALRSNISLRPTSPSVRKGSDLNISTIHVSSSSASDTSMSPKSVNPMTDLKSPNPADGSPKKPRTVNPATKTNLKRFFLSGQSLSPKPQKKTPTPPAAEAVEEEWEVERILAHDERVAEKGKKTTYYLIKWVGEWDDTWEPSENVGRAAVKEYKAGLKKADTKVASGTTNKQPVEKRIKRKREGRQAESANDEADEEAYPEPATEAIRRRTRSASASTNLGENSRPQIRVSHSPGLFVSSPDVDDSMVDHNGRTVEMMDLDEEVANTISEDDLYEADSPNTRAPIAQMFAQSKVRGQGNGKGKEVIRPPPIDISSSASSRSQQSTPDIHPAKATKQVVIISSGESESTGNEEDDLF